MKLGWTLVVLLVACSPGGVSPERATEIADSTYEANHDPDDDAYLDCYSVLPPYDYLCGDTVYIDTTPVEVSK